MTETRQEPAAREQVRAAREGIGFINRAEVGKLAITGADRFSWLQGMISNDVTRLKNGAFDGFFQACVLDATGHLLTDLSLVPVRAANSGENLASALGLPNEDFLLADLPRVNLEKIKAVFDRFLIMEDVEIHDVTAQLGCVALLGPMARAKLDEEGDSAERDPLAGCRDFTVTMSANYGAPGFNIYFPVAQETRMQAALARADVTEIQSAAQEILRVEAGLPKYGADMDETTIALEAGLGPTHISLTKGCYVGQEIIARIESRGHTNRALTGFVVENVANVGMEVGGAASVNVDGETRAPSGTGGGLPEPSDKLFAETENGEWRETGRITSVLSASPAMDGRTIALGYARHEHRAPGASVRVEGRDVRLTVVELPFYRGPSG